MSEKVWIGIDPGSKGAVAVVNDKNEVVLIVDFIDVTNMANLLYQISNHYDVQMAAIEKVHAMPGQGVTSMFNFGMNYGSWQGACAALGIALATVTPQTWMKGVVPPKSDKKAIAAICKRMYPMANLLGPKGGLKDGRSDAILIASWCKRNY